MAMIPSSLSDYCLTRSEQSATTFEAAFWFVLAEWSETDTALSETLDEYHARALALREARPEQFTSEVLKMARRFSNEIMKKNGA
jgi:hypothetical protein